jgi:hypothetical protein
MTTQNPPLAASAEHLTAALRKFGVLADGHVSGVVEVASFPKQRSYTRRLRLDYEGHATNAPRSVMLKMGHLDAGGRPAYANRREIAFYRDIAPSLPARVVPQCFDAADTTEASVWHLLLEDLTDSHFIATEHPLPPMLAQCEGIVRAWARFHAAWWDDPRLGVLAGSWPDADWEQYLTGFPEQLARFSGRFGEVVPPERHEFYNRFLDRAPRLLARYRARRNLTLIHGDAHWWNCFVPHGGEDSVRLIDWEGWSIDTATTDIAYMMAMLWYPDRRRRAEQSLLDCYHAELLAGGVSDYSRHELNDDYRLSVLWLILRPVMQAAFNIPPRVWWPNLERIFLAVDDLDCRELLG